MAFADRGTALVQNDVPTFAECEVIGEWTEVETNEVQEVRNEKGVVINLNKSDGITLQVDTQVIAFSTEISDLDLLTETNGATRKWIVKSASKPKSGNVRAQDVTLIYSEDEGTSVFASET